MSKTKTKLCPLVKEDCLKSGCELYNELVNRCDVGLLAYNLFRLSQAMKLFGEATNGGPEEGKEPAPARYGTRRPGGIFNDRRILQ